MNRRVASVVLTAISILPALAVTLVAADFWPSPGRAERAEDFQRLVGGLGFGPALDVTRCARSFDPRLAPCCSDEGGPIPGGVFFCPHHAAAVFYYPPCPDAESSRDDLLP